MEKNNGNTYIINGDCEIILKTLNNEIPNVLPIDCTFLDPPFNQGKEYVDHDDNQPPEQYWNWMLNICNNIYSVTSKGGCVFFMHREKNLDQVLQCLRDSSWIFQNLIIWKKRTSAIPQSFRFNKQYQIIVFATKGEKPRVFNKLKIDMPLEDDSKLEREDWLHVTDVWDDIKELTSGYFAGKEALRQKVTGERLHKQQSPISLLLRIILATTRIGDKVLDPFAGSGTTNVVASQLERISIGIEKNQINYELIKHRLDQKRHADSIMQYYDYYRYTDNIKEIWQGNAKNKQMQKALF